MDRPCRPCEDSFKVFAHRHDVRAKVNEINMSATKDSGTSACVLVHACAYTNSCACMPVCVWDAHVVVSMHMRAVCAYVNSYACMPVRV